MAYRYVAFDDVPLPLLNPREDHSPAPSERALARTIGGYYAHDTTISPSASQNIVSTASYVGELTYWVDETGDYLVDDTGDYLIFGDAVTMLHSQVNALREKMRQWGQLWRERISDGVLEWKRAHLSNMREQHDYTKGCEAEITYTFVSEMTNWHAEDATTVSEEALDGEWVYLTIDNSGATIYDAVLTIICTDGTITDILIESTPMGIDLEWSGALAENFTLVIDSSSDPLPDDIEAAFDGFVYGADHSVAGWLPIETGQWFLGVFVEGGDATIELSYYLQSA